MLLATPPEGSRGPTTPSSRPWMRARLDGSYGLATSRQPHSLASPEVHTLIPDDLLPMDRRCWPRGGDPESRPGNERKAAARHGAAPVLQRALGGRRLLHDRHARGFSARLARTSRRRSQVRFPGKPAMQRNDRRVCRSRFLLQAMRCLPSNRLPGDRGARARPLRRLRPSGRRHDEGAMGELPADGRPGDLLGPPGHCELLRSLAGRREAVRESASFKLQALGFRFQRGSRHSRQTSGRRTAQQNTTDGSCGAPRRFQVAGSELSVTCNLQPVTNESCHRRLFVLG